MKSVHTISAIILSAVMAGCGGGNKQSTDELITVDVTKSYSPKKELILQDFMDVEYITLETNDDFVNQGFVQDIGKEIILVKNRINDGDIFVYDRTGKALQKINHKGQGGEDYTNILGITLDEENNEMYVHNHYERKIQVYDLYGKFKRSLKYKENTNGMFYTDIFNYDKENLICFDKFNEERAFVLLSKQDGSIAKKIEIPFKEPKLLWQIDASRNVPADPGPYRTIISFKDNWILIEHSSDTVYTLLPDYSLHPFLVRTPSIQSMNPEFLLLRLFSDRYYFMETIQNVFDFDTRKGFPKTFMMYDKQEKAFFGYNVYNGDYTTKKEIYMNVLRPANHEIESWQTIEPFELIESYEKGELKGKLKEIAATLDEDDNPVIMLVKHKK
jgi:hypothetical protein